MWSTLAHVADWAFVLARTHFGVPKHRGLSTFIMPLNAKGVTINPIRLATGTSETCQEFLDDVIIRLQPGRRAERWVDRRFQAAFSRTQHGRPYVLERQPPDKAEDDDAPDPLLALVKQLGVGSDPIVRQKIGEAMTLPLVLRYGAQHISSGLQSGRIPPAGASMLKQLGGLTIYRRHELAVEIAGSEAVAWDGEIDDGQPGNDWLSARIATVAGGSNEMQRNNISERVLGLPRDPMTVTDPSPRSVTTERVAI